MGRYDESMPLIAPHPEPLLAQLGFVNLSSNHRIDELMQMFAELSEARTPKDVLSRYAASMRRMYAQRCLISLSQRDLGDGEYRITRWIDSTGVNRVSTDNPWRDRLSLPVHQGGFFGKVAATPEPKLAHHLRIRNDPVAGNELASFGSMLAVPAFADGRLTYWSMIFEREPEALTEQDLEEAMLRVNLIGTAVLQVDAMARLREASEHIAEEIRNIARIQRALLPPDIPCIQGLSIATSYETFDTAGGDIYDFTPFNAESLLAGPTPDSQWAILIGDVSGHGPAAAVMMAMVHAILHTYPRFPDRPGEVLAYLNHHLMQKQLDGAFITALLAFYNPADRSLTYARAGHPPALVKPAGVGGRLRSLDDVGHVPLGILEDAAYEDSRVTLHPGETLVLYTDGITEALGPDRQMFGVEGIEQGPLRMFRRPPVRSGRHQQHPQTPSGRSAAER